MGTAAIVDVPCGLDPELGDAVFTWLRWVDDTFTVHRASSQIRRIAAGTLEEGSADPRVREVLDAATRMSVRTDGWFTMYPPGHAYRIDPSGYVKGWSVDIAADMVEAAGVAAFAVSVGGDIRLRGGPAPGRPWTVGIRHPRVDGSTAAVLHLDSGGVATSGRYERGEHVWGRDGDPTLLGVTVVGPLLAIADSLATAILAADDPRPVWLERFPAYEVLAITSDDRVLRSPGLAADV